MSREAEFNFIGAIFENPNVYKNYDIVSDDFMDIRLRSVYVGIEKLASEDSLTLDSMFDYYSKSSLFDTFVDIQANTFNCSEKADVYANVIKRDSKSKLLASIGEEIKEIASSYGAFDDKLEKSIDLIKSIPQDGFSDLPEFRDVILSAINQLQERINTEGLTGIDTKFKILNDVMNGLQKQELTILGARPSMGKSTFALNLAVNVASQGYRVVFFSLEMPKERLLDKIASAESKILCNEIKIGSKDIDWGVLSQALQKIQDYDLLIDDKSGQSINQIQLKCKKLSMAKPIDLIIIDYLQLVGGTGRTRTEEIGSITRKLKDLSKELNCHIITLSQLSRGVEERPNKRPRSSDLRDSGEIEQDADNILFLYRDEIYYPDHYENKGFAELIITKLRFGEIGEFKMECDLSRSYFYDLTCTRNYNSYDSYMQQQKEQTQNNKSGFSRGGK
jgi:replicative DNA helicase